MTNSNPLAGDVVNVFVEHLHLPKPFVRQVIGVLKAADRIDSGRPVTPPPTPRGIARILLALASPTIKDAVRHGRGLGTMALHAGDNHLDLETALTDIVEEAAGWRSGDTNFRDGKVVVSDHTAFIGSAIYRSEGPHPGLQRFISIEARAIAQIARELLPTSGAHS